MFAAYLAILMREFILTLKLRYLNAFCTFLATLFITA